MSLRTESESSSRPFEPDIEMLNSNSSKWWVALVRFRGGIVLIALTAKHGDAFARARREDP